MKLRRALKVKKQLLKEITELQTKIAKNNSVLENNFEKREYSTKEIYNELLEKINQLVTLKLVIAKANENIQYEIYMLSEYKSLVTFLKTVNTNNGVVSEYGKDLITYKAEMTQKDIEDIIKALEKQIDSMQDTIDEYNAVTEVDFNLKD